MTFETTTTPSEKVRWLSMSRDFHDPLPNPPTYNDTFLATPHFIEDLPPPPHFDDYGEIKHKDPDKIDQRLRHYLTADSDVVNT